jgi:hypothetical protein
MLGGVAGSGGERAKSEDNIEQSKPRYIHTLVVQKALSEGVFINHRHHGMDIVEVGVDELLGHVWGR